ncbi:hypothetical protein OIU79_029714 [Salix purpurea]|uniref:Uncharacterized protein n=1 Tax=Salix purpurea TaxID=77065 RepID=A0A9Q0VHE7_SALPP|nr:hypothetical protein OIU79_029714 [Salix purpurea]
MRQHDHVNVHDSLGGKARVRSHRENAFDEYHLPILRQRVIAFLQKT